MKTFFNLHFTELKFHFNCFFILQITLCIILYFYNEQVLFLFIKPLILIKKSNYFIFTNLNEIILLKLVISGYLSFFLMFHIFILQAWVFSSPGLNKIKNLSLFKILIIYINISFIYNYLFFKILIPIILNFFIQFKIDSTLIDIFFEPRIYNFIKMILNFILLFFCVFNYIFFLVIILKSIKRVIFIKYRKFLYFKILILVTLISPPDIFSQLFLSLLIIIFIESLLFFKFFN